MIRPAAATDLHLLPAIDGAACAQFRALGMGFVADDPPSTVAELEPSLHAGRLWVATVGGRIVGYAIADVIDGSAHLEQVSVDPDWAGRRLGAALIDEVARWSVTRGDRWLTLTTYVEVPWNAPYYRRLGFAPVPDAQIGPELRAVRAREAAHGLDAWPRTAMRRPLAHQD